MFLDTESILVPPSLHSFGIYSTMAMVPFVKKTNVKIHFISPLDAKNASMPKMEGD